MSGISHQIVVELVTGQAIGGSVASGSGYWAPKDGSIHMTLDKAQVTAAFRVEENGDLVVNPGTRQPVTFAAGTWLRVGHEIAVLP